MFLKDDCGSHSTAMKTAWMLSELLKCCRTCTVCDTKGWTRFLNAGRRCRSIAGVKGQLMNKTRQRGWPHLYIFFDWHPELAWNESTQDTEIQDLLREKREVGISSNSLNFTVVWHITKRQPPDSTFYLQERFSLNILVGFLFRMPCACRESSHFNLSDYFK